MHGFRKTLLLYGINFWFLGNFASAQKIYLIPFAGCYKKPATIFDIHGPYNRDNCVRPYYLLKQELERQGWAIQALTDPSQVPPEGILVVFNIPSDKKFVAAMRRCRAHKKIAWLWEPPIKKHTRNFDAQLHLFFDKIYTWAPEYIDNKKYFAFYTPYPEITIPEKSVNFENKKDIVMVAGYQKSRHLLSLCELRVDFVDYCDSIKSACFDVYGSGWGSRIYGYRGKVKDKLALLRQYKFVICYENCQTPGYVSEKIFDAFCAGAVPVYYGAPDITQYIPENCYINARNFKTPAELYNYLMGISSNEYTQLRAHINQFLCSQDVQKFSVDNFIKIFIESLL